LDDHCIKNCNIDKRLISYYNESKVKQKSNDRNNENSNNHQEIIEFNTKAINKYLGTKQQRILPIKTPFNLFIY